VRYRWSDRYLPASSPVTDSEEARVRDILRKLRHDGHDRDAVLRRAVSDARARPRSRRWPPPPRRFAHALAADRSSWLKAIALTAAGIDVVPSSAPGS
jgi:hypothetical protein